MLTNREEDTVGEGVAEDAMREGVAEAEQDEDEETRRIATKKAPAAPTAAEIREHNINHLPYRQWCKHCVAGRRRDDRHVGREEESGRSEIHVDYFFPKDAVGEEPVTCISLRHKQKKVTAAHVVPTKGASSSYVVDAIVKDIQQMGEHGALSMRGDQEHAIDDVLRAVA